MVQGIELSAANPIPLVRGAGSFEWYSEAYHQSCYCQKFEPTDSTALQILSDSPLTVQAALTDRYGARIGTIAVSYPDSGIAGVHLAELRPDFSSLSFEHGEAPVCWIAGTVQAAGRAYDIRSQRPLLISSFPESCFLEYSASENSHSVVFTTGIVFGLRAEGGFIPKSYLPASDDTIYKDEPANFVSLKSTPYSTYYFRTGSAKGIPDWLHSIINVAFSCSELLVDGVPIVKTEEAEWQPNEIEGNDLREWSILVSKATNSGVYSLAPASSVFWSSYYCQLLEEAFAFTVHLGDRTAKLSGLVTLTLQKTDGTTYTRSAPYRGYQDVRFALPIAEAIVGIRLTADGALDTPDVQLIALLQPQLERAVSTVTLPLPVQHDVLPADGSTAIGKDGSKLLLVMINQPLTP